MRDQFPALAATVTKRNLSAEISAARAWHGPRARRGNARLDLSPGPRSSLTGKVKTRAADEPPQKREAVTMPDRSCGASEDVRHCLSFPFAAAGRGDAAPVQGGGDLAEGLCAGSLGLAYRRQDGVGVGARLSL
jgi:hypothetical protein